MAQKDKVKELVGRGLHSYHTKSLQQMDRIEKKNKEQNHKISILSNELDNDYLTKTEEGSVISLEHSKEGMVYLDELQGNTLVNYCTDGSKEMTLNGDIDVEGTFVTTTEGVDNGKVDIMCEGNTLVSHKGEQAVSGGNAPFQLDKEIVIKEYNTYIALCSTPAVDGEKIYFRLDFTKLSHNDLLNNGFTTSRGIGGYDNIIFTKEQIKEMPNNTRTTISAIRQVKGSEFPDKTEHSYSIGIKTLLQQNEELFRFKVNDYQIINLTQIFGKGNEPSVEWCDKNIPYFEGMKSVGQDDENGHKIEILSQNKNIYSGGVLAGGIRYGNTEKYNCFTDEVGLGNPLRIRSEYPQAIHPNTEYNITMTNYTGIIHLFFYDKKGNYLNNINYINTSNEGNFTSPLNAYYLHFFTISDATLSVTNENYKVFLKHGYGSIDYVEPKLNKKEISLNEPLRKVNENYKDRFVKIGGKWFIERNTMELDMGSVTFSTYALSDEYPDVFDFYYTPSNVIQSSSDNRCICNILPSVLCGFPGIINHNIEGIDVNGTHIKGSIYRTKLTELSSNGLKEYFNKVGARVVYPLETPIYEPLETNPELLVYNDVTHISNNSIIPCNMKIKNTGYNAIIKPSTLYTVSLDTNKSGTIGMNLGGAKGTTTNNVATITTPATLADDSLRLYGKGIKGSKVRLLEGDKTNWIPSFFEGMKSSFEDKFDTTDNTYKMEILSNNKNLFDGNWTRVGNSKQHKTSHIKVSPNSNYIFSVSDNYNTNSAERRFNVEFYDKHKNYLGFIVTGYLPNNVKINTPYNCKYIKIITRANTDFTGEYTNIEDCDVQLEKGMEVTSYVSPKSNKIQFSSIEPLRKWDRFVFKDGKLMIERYSKKVDLGVEWSSKQQLNTGIYRYVLDNVEGIYSMAETICNTITTVTLDDISDKVFKYQTNTLWYQTYDDFTLEELKEFFKNNNTTLIFKLKEPTYEEIPFELQKIILEGYENGTLFFDTNIPPTSTVTYAGETPIVKSVRLNKTEVSNNTNDINDNIIPYLMDMDYRVVCLQLQSENINDGVSMARLFGGAYEMLQRDIQSKRYSVDEYRHRLDAYLDANKITEEEYNKLGDMLNE